MNEDESTKEDYDNAIRTMCDIADRRAEALQEVFQRMMRRVMDAPEKQPEKQPSAPFIGLDGTGPLGGDWPTGPIMFAYCDKCAILYLATLGKFMKCDCGDLCPSLTAKRVTGSR